MPPSLVQEVDDLIVCEIQEGVSRAQFKVTETQYTFSYLNPYIIRCSSDDSTSSALAKYLQTQPPRFAKGSVPDNVLTVPFYQPSVRDPRSANRKVKEEDSDSSNEDRLLVSNRASQESKEDQVDDSSFTSKLNIVLDVLIEEFSFAPRTEKEDEVMEEPR